MRPNDPTPEIHTANTQLADDFNLLLTQNRNRLGESANVSIRVPAEIGKVLTEIIIGEKLPMTASALVRQMLVEALCRRHPEYMQPVLEALTDKVTSKESL